MVAKSITPPKEVGFLRKTPLCSLFILLRNKCQGSRRPYF